MVKNKVLILSFLLIVTLLVVGTITADTIIRKQAMAKAAPPIYEKNPYYKELKARICADPITECPEVCTFLGSQDMGYGDSTCRCTFTHAIIQPIELKDCKEACSWHGSKTGYSYYGGDMWCYCFFDLTFRC